MTVDHHRVLLVKVYSEAGSGTVFHIYLPALEIRKQREEVKAAETRVPGGNESILLVEDEAPLRALVRNVLERYGYQIVEAGSGVEALEVWREHADRIDLLLTDMVMPDGMTGQELAQRLQADNSRLKVIFTSGYSADVVGKDFVLRDGVNFLQKPYHPRKLAQTVRSCLDGGA